MRTTIKIHPYLENVEIEIPKGYGARFTRDIIEGNYMDYRVNVSPADLKRIKQFAVKYGDDKSSNGGYWYAHCISFAMGLFVNYRGDVTINTYRPYGEFGNIKE